MSFTLHNQVASKLTCKKLVVLAVQDFHHVLRVITITLILEIVQNMSKNLPQSVRSKVRFISNNDCVILERFIKSTISEHKSQGTSDCSVLFHISVDNNLATKVMEGVELMELVLLRTFHLYLSTLLCVQLK